MLEKQSETGESDCEHRRPKFSGRAIVGLDLDGVCADYTDGFRRFWARHRGIEPNELATPPSYSLVSAGWGFNTTEDYLRHHRTAVNEGLYQNLPVITGAPEAAQAIAKAGAHIRIVTHRLIFGGSHEKIVSDTAKWLDQAQIPYMSLCFTGLKDSVGAHVYIDDSPSNVQALRAMNFETFVFSQPYNRQVTGPRINDWESGAAQVIAYLAETNELNG